MQGALVRTSGVVDRCYGLELLGQGRYRQVALSRLPGVSSCFADTRSGWEFYGSVTVASWPLFYCGSCICFARRRAIASRSGSADNNINLFFYGPLWAGRRISGMSTLGSWTSVTDIVAEVPLANKVFNLVFEVMALLGVMFVLPMEATISSPVSPFEADQIRRPKDPLLSDLEENLYPGRI
ncbi:hypothetical protein GW17_00006863 [Ensete ventricosum]|nr:hypothetical protein GW17_00006863 [Ensete ventricosum]